jgi:hypothetical protein
MLFHNEMAWLRLPDLYCSRPFSKRIFLQSPIRNKQIFSGKNTFCQKFYIALHGGKCPGHPVRTEPGSVGRPPYSALAGRDDGWSEVEQKLQEP